MKKVSSFFVLSLLMSSMLPSITIATSIDEVSPSQIEIETNQEKEEQEKKEKEELEQKEKEEQEKKEKEELEQKEKEEQEKKEKEELEQKEKEEQEKKEKEEKEKKRRREELEKKKKEELDKKKKLEQKEKEEQLKEVNIREQQKKLEKKQEKEESDPNKEKKEIQKTISNKELDSFVATPGSFKTVANETNEQFIMKIGNKARKIGHKNDLYASVMIAQAALESNFGKSQLSTEPNYNLFGIKGAFKGKTVNMLTSEDTSKGYINITSGFRKYESYDDSLKDYAKLMTEGINGNSSIYKGSNKKNSETYKEATKKLTGVYATDRHYHEKLNAIIEAYDLTRFDKSLTKKTEYKILEKDTLKSIAKKFKVEEKDILKLNPSLDTAKELKPNSIIHIEEDIEFEKPLNGKYQISSDFGSRSGEHHNGIDLAIAANSPVYATQAGTVESVGYDKSAGNYIIIKHEYGLYSSYFHLNEINVKKGQKIDQIQKIGLVGSTGNSTGPHLHFAISDDVWSQYYNPKEFVSLD